MREYTRQSRVIIYDNGVVVLQFMSLEWDVPGAYTYANGVFSIHFGGNWDARAEIKGDVLTMRYGDYMIHSDFEDAVYTLVK